MCLDVEGSTSDIHLGIHRSIRDSHRHSLHVERCIRMQVNIGISLDAWHETDSRLQLKIIGERSSHTHIDTLSTSTHIQPYVVEYRSLELCETTCHKHQAKNSHHKDSSFHTHLILNCYYFSSQ